MNYTHLGRTGLKVSRLCLGTMNFGDVTDEKTSARILDERLRRVSISLIQQTCMALNNLPISSKARGCPRKLLVAGFSRVAAVNASFWRQKSISLWGQVRTIAGFLRIIFARPARTVCDGLRPTILTSIRCITSIVIRRGKRSGRPWKMHHIDRHTPWEEIWQAMELLVQQGKVLYIGSSNFAGWDIATAQSVATARHFLGLVAEQSLYNLTARTIELEVIPACRHFGLGLIPWSPLAGGLLGGVLKKMASAPCQARVCPSNRTVSSAAGSLRGIM